MKNLKVIFMGTPDFAIPVLEKLIKETNVVLVISQPDKMVGRHQILTPSPIKELALKNNIKVLTPKKIKDDYEEILNTKADIIITCAYGQIIPEEILNYPTLGCINVHASLLPKYRGGAPIHWALINGEEKTGITIMYMDKLMDNGDIIEQEEYKILDSDNVQTLHEKLSIMGANLLIKTLPSIISKTNKRIKQKENEVSFAYNIKREDEILSFDDFGKNILNKIRGLNPWPLANIKIDGKEIKILKAHFEKSSNKKTSIVVKVDKNCLGISCLDGIIYLDEIKKEGKKAMLIKDFLNGINKDEYLNKEVNEEKNE